MLDYVGARWPNPCLSLLRGRTMLLSVVLDPSKTETEFGWKAKVDFQDTITGQLAWYDKYGVTDIFSHLSAPKT